MVIRMFLSAVAPADIDNVISLFSEDVVPAFRAHPDCLGIELVMADQPNISGLVEGGVITRWTSVEAMEQALASETLVACQSRVRGYLRREPIRKVFHVMV